MYHSHDSDQGIWVGAQVLFAKLPTRPSLLVVPHRERQHVYRFLDDVRHISSVRTRDVDRDDVDLDTVGHAGPEIGPDAEPECVPAGDHDVHRDLHPALHIAEGDRIKVATTELDLIFAIRGVDADVLDR